MQIVLLMMQLSPCMIALFCWSFPVIMFAEQTSPDSVFEDFS